jgi:hypothetical protein
MYQIQEVKIFMLDSKTTIVLQIFCGQEFAGKKVVLTGDEEKAYLDKILKDRTIKCQKVHKKQRGRDKLLKKANKLIANHKRFDE